MALTKTPRLPYQRGSSESLPIILFQGSIWRSTRFQYKNETRISREAFSSRHWTVAFSSRASSKDRQWIRIAWPAFSPSCCLLILLSHTDLSAGILGFLRQVSVGYPRWWFVQNHGRSRLLPQERQSAELLFVESSSQQHLALSALILLAFSNFPCLEMRIIVQSPHSREFNSCCQGSQLNFLVTFKDPGVFNSLLNAPVHLQGWNP